MAERSKSSDLDLDLDPDFSAFFWDGELSVTRIDG